MKIRSISSFKDRAVAESFFEKWVSGLSGLNRSVYERINIETCLGKTVVWGINANRIDLRTIVIFPGFRTCGLFWDMDNGLAPLKNDFRIFMVDTNGQPSLSEGKTPDIRTEDYGFWANEVLEQLIIEKTIIAGASLGALVCLKLCVVAPEKIEKAVLLNPGCLQPFSLSFKNLYYNLLPLISPKRNNVEKFLDNAVFYKDQHVVSPKAKKLIIDYELFAIKEFNDKAQKPYPLAKTDLESIQTDIYLVVGDKDILFPYKKSIRVARKYFRLLKAVYILSDTGHGIETSKKAMTVLSAIATLETQKNN